MRRHSTYRELMDAMEPTPEQLLAALDASELVESVQALTEAQRGDLLERIALLVGANRSVSVAEFRGELADILASAPTFHAVLHGGRFDGQVMELDPEDFDTDVVCAAADETDAAGGDGEASGVLHSLYRLSAGEPAPGATVHYEFRGLVAADAT